MMNNCYFRVKVHQVDGGLKFEHPTLPGAQSGGWMFASDDEAPATAAAVVVPSKPPNESVLAVSDANTMIVRESKKYTMSEVAMHVTAEDCWFIHNGKVYDSTSFMSTHPGGADSILIVAGQDCTGKLWLKCP